jgi:tetratricopeptide (TPR) repeat protein
MNPGRNDPCPCGSGSKYKHCCGTVSALSPGAQQIGALVGLVNQERLREAEQGARALLAKHPGAGILWKILSVALVRQGRDALNELRRAAQLLPEDAEAQRNLGSALYDGEKYEEALASLERALALQPDAPPALIDAGNALRALGRARESLPLYERALALEPRSREALNNLGNSLLELGQCAEAVGCYGRALELQPNDAQVLCNLGNALRQLGRHPEAVRCSQRALALEPGLSMAHNNLGLSLTALGRRREAVASYRQAVRLNPHYVEALNNLGNTLRDLGERDEALALHFKAVELAPQRADSYVELGNALFELRRIDEAAAGFRRALALEPRATLAHLGLASALRMQGRNGDAQESCRAALEIEPGSAAALALLGELRADRGEFEPAHQLFLRAIAADADFASAFCSMAGYRRMTPADTGWLDGVLALLAKPLPLAQEIALRYALGKYLDDVGRYDEAFASYRAANELTKRFGANYDRAKLAQRVERIIGGVDAAFHRRAAPGASASELPVFVVGMPRSGTSLTEQILASHPDVFGAGEVRFWDKAFAVVQAAGFGSEAVASLVPRLAEDYLARVTALAGDATRVIDKMPANFLYAGLIHAVFPRARIIHMQRHPLDTCVSIYFQNFFSMGPYANDFTNLAHYYGEYRRVTAHWRSMLPATTLLEVPYEALLADQEGWTRRMLEFIGLPWDPKCLDFHRTERVVITASRWQVRQRITTASAGRWRNYEKHLEPLRQLLDGVSGEGAAATGPAVVPLAVVAPPAESAAAAHGAAR